MGYQLGVDLGTTYSAAAICRDGRVEIASLGGSNPATPSVVLLRADGEVLTGDAAVRRGLNEPSRVGREFKRRLGDPTPLVLGGTPYSAEALLGHLLRAIVETITVREGAEPERVVLTHPATYGPYKLEQMREVARLGGLDLNTTSFLTEPQAAAISYASRNRVEPGEIVAVYDLGGGTFDVALVQNTAQGFTIIGLPEGMDRFGGIDIDAAIVAFVDRSLDGAPLRLASDDFLVQVAFTRLREDCRAAKEALSSDTDTAIRVTLPGLQTEVRLTRSELEGFVRPRLQETVAALVRAVESAHLTMGQISRILLVGGSSRMPLIGEFIRNATGRPISVDADPKFVIALGAAGLGLDVAKQSESTSPAAVPTPLPTPLPIGASAQQTTTAVVEPAEALAPAAIPFASAHQPPEPKRPRRLKLVVVLVAAVLAVAAGVVAFVSLQGGPASGASSTSAPTAATAPESAAPATTIASAAPAATAPPATAPPATAPPATAPPVATAPPAIAPPATAPPATAPPETAPPVAEVPNVFRLLQADADAALRAAGYIPTFGRVCSGSVGDGEVRQVVIFVGGKEVEVVGKDGVVAAQAQLPAGTELTVKVGTGKACS